ncbi:MAG: hypothetical protein A2V65_08935 [Deltaproteobacteria bacterium RBG_13_49_15]|nr:MAG: hypothetical protein A2V65_08935 [Deltaproteobacteria bacterium RBG_13_49_15]
MISHTNTLAIFDALDAVVPAYETDVAVLFLPLSHVFERVAGHLYGLKVGITAHYTESQDTLMEDIQTKRPTIILAVPRFLEKVYARIIARIKAQPSWRRRIFSWAQDVGGKVNLIKERKERIPLSLAIKHRLAYLLIFRKLKEKLGGRLRWMTAAGAPLSREIANLFNGAGIFVMEGYGLTESTAPVSLNVIQDYRFGTAGRPLPCNQVRIAPDGEILVRRSNIWSPSSS